MAGIGAHTYAAISDVAYPSLPFRPDTSYLSKVSVRGSNYYAKYAAAGVPVSGAWVEADDLWVLADGYSPMRVYKNRTFARLGLLPPYPDDIGVTPTGQKAWEQLVFIAVPNAGDSFRIGDPLVARRITFVAALLNPGDPGYPGDQVLIDTGGTPLPTTIANLAALVNNTAGHGSIYHNSAYAYGFPTYTFADYGKVTAENVTPTTIDFYATDYGAGGNSYIAVFQTNTSGMAWLSTGGAGPYPANMGYLSNGSAGTGTAPLQGNYNYSYRYYRALDGAVSGLGDIVPMALADPMNVDLVTVDSDDPEVTQMQWFRSLHQAGLFYYGGSFDTGSGGGTDDVLDTELAVSDPYNDVEYRPFASGHVPSYRVVEDHLDCVFAGGAHILRDVAVSLECVEDSHNAAPTTGTQPWQSAMEGGVFYPDAYPDDEYIVVDYRGAGPEVRFNKPWNHTTGTVTGTWRDGRDRTGLDRSEPFAPNQWPPANFLGTVADETDEGITALKAFWSRLNVFTPENIFALSGTFEAFQLRRVSSGIGSVSHAGVVGAEGLLFFPGPGAFYMWDGNSTPIDLTFPPGETRGMKATMDRINWRVADVISGHYDSDERIIRWAVPLDNAWYPTHTLTFDLQRKAWGIDTGLYMDHYRTIADGGRKYAMGVGHNRFFFLNLEASENYFGGTHVTTISSVSAINGTITLASSAGVDEVFSAVVVTSDGSYYEVSLHNDGSGVCEVLRGLDTIPNLTAGDQVLRGGILMWLRTGEMSFGYMGRAGRVTDIDLGFVPQTPSGRVYVAVGADDGDTALPEFGEAYGDLTDSDGHFRTRLNTAARRHTLDLISALPGGQPELVEIGLGYRTPNKQRYPQ